MNLFLQIPLAGVVAFVVQMFLKHLQASDSRQDEQQNRMINYLTQMDNANREFIGQQGELHSKTTEHLAEEIKLLREEQNKMNGILLAQNVRAPMKTTKRDNTKLAE